MTHLLVGDRVRLAESTTRDPSTQGARHRSRPPRTMYSGVFVDGQ